MWEVEHAGIRVDFCPSCDWAGTYEDWERETGEERWCETDYRYKRVCPDDHCLECGRST